MKTLKTLSTALLVIVAFTAMAKGPMVRNSFDKTSKTIAAPAFDWGNPEDADTETAKMLKYSGITAPAMVWGSAQDLNENELEVLKVRDMISLEEPAFNWGTPEDLNLETLEDLKSRKYSITFPEMVIGSPEDIDASGLK